MVKKRYTLKFRFVTFNVLLVILILLFFRMVGTYYIGKYLVNERTLSRKVVNEQAAVSAISVMVGDEKNVRFIDDYKAKYPDIVYSVAIRLNSKMRNLTGANDTILYLKNEEGARQYNDLFTLREEKTKVEPRGDMLNIISPVYGINNEGEESLLGYLVSGYSLRALYQKLDKIMMIVGIIFMGASLMLSIAIFTMTSVFLKPLESAVEIINNVACGDFTRTVSVSAKSEIGILLNTVNRMVATWRSSIEKLKVVVEQINAHSKRMSETATLQEHSTAEQATAVSEITTTLDELSSSSRQVKEKAEKVSQSSHDVLSLASEGQKAVAGSIEEINTIRTKIRKISEHTLNLSLEAQQIGSIVKTVSDIANKTDMLAINAAIEAARAREHGKGFSIVANEVRDLADKSQKSAEKIATLIESIQSATTTTVLSTEEALRGFQVGLQLISESGQTLRNLVAHIEDTVNYAGEIALAARQQSSGTEQVTGAMATINEGMKVTARGAALVLQDADNLKKLSRELSGVAGAYTL